MAIGIDVNVSLMKFQPRVDSKRFQECSLAQRILPSKTGTFPVYRKHGFYTD